MIENEIISSVYSEEMYLRVKFLEAKDFQNPVNQQLWRLIQSVEGDTVAMIAKISQSERLQWTNTVKAACLGVAMYKVAEMGLKLVSMRFERLLNDLLNDLISRSPNLVEKHYLNQIQKELPSIDILKLAPVISEYFESKAGDEATTYAKQRLNDFSNYVQKRIEQIKSVTNEH